MRRQSALLTPGVLAASLVVLSPVTVQAAVTISTAATKNMVCFDDVCSPTNKDAILNVSDLETLLTSGNVTVTTGSVTLASETINIVVATGVTWSSAATLRLDAYEAVTINAPMSVTGRNAGGVSIVTNDGGTGGLFSFGNRGRLTFASPANNLIINGAPYLLVRNIATLVSAIAANPEGHYALAADYDATTDGIYASSPIPTAFNGIFEGLGNTISSLSIKDVTESANVALFAFINSDGIVDDLRLTNVHVVSSLRSVTGSLVAQNNGGHLNDDSASGRVAGRGYLGGLVGSNQSPGVISHAHATTDVDSGNGIKGAGGGLAYYNGGTISDSYATGSVTGNGPSGGLVYENGGSIDSSFATGAVAGPADNYNGGLASFNGGTITNSYATGSVEGGQSIGGFAGYCGSISNSYSTGAVTASSAEYLGGFAGYAYAQGLLTNTYWDTTTSGITDPGQGVGNSADYPGITGLTTAQLQSALPAGFDSSVWGLNPAINGGLPYLLANPPR